MGPIQGPYILQLYMGPVPHTFGGLTPPPYFAQWLVRSRSPETAGNVTRPLPLGLSETPFLSALPRRQSILMPLQRAQNAAARLVLGLDRRSHTTAALTRFTLAAGKVPHHIQARITDALGSSPAVSNVSVRPRRVQRSTPSAPISGDFVP